MAEIIKPDWRIHIPVLDKFEGGINTWDSAGLTMRGVTRGRWQDVIRRRRYNWNASDDGLKNITQLQWEAVVKDNWDLATNYNDIDKTAPALIFAETFWAMGGGGIKLLQAELNRMGYGPLSVDGAVGPQTVAAVNKAAKYDETALVNNLLAAQWKGYDNPNNPNYQASIVGWRNRWNFFSDYVKKKSTNRI